VSGAKAAGEFGFLAGPARRALAGAGYSRLEQLASARRSDLAKLHGMGPNALARLSEALAARRLRFAGD